ncbi:MAG: preprotein translocase subunit SecA [Candidatus Falkowbacteria bacterium]|nr:preprotein translocase subunit SecA [Candidatus Falkowbacteria bacterium]
MMSVITKIFGDPNAKVIKSLDPLVKSINSLEEKFSALSDEELKNLTTDFRRRLGVSINEEGRPVQSLDQEEEAKILEDILPEAFAAVREAAQRVNKQRHYDVQLIGGIILHLGRIAEMKTGEGKTLVATLPLYLNALPGRGVHLVTVNDYLSQVGAGWMAPVYHALGLSTAVIIHEKALMYDPEYNDEKQFDERLRHFREVERQAAYRCDVLYGTNNEFGFDYLKDNMVDNLDSMVQRELYYSIVDEVDSILIDEARTPLIISAPAEESTDRYYKFAQFVNTLQKDEDYNIDEKMKASTFTESAVTKLESWLGVDNIYATGGIRDIHHAEQALKAKALFERDKDYVVRDGEIVIVDEFTGRLMFGRRYSEGLHQAIEAKEGVKVQRESRTLATVTFQNYFRMYRKLSGMTGTAITEAEEFFKIYKLDTVSIPTNKPTVRRDLNDLIYSDEDAKFKAVVKEIKARHDSGQPVLVGTISIERNEYLGALLEREGVQAQVLNAKHHEKEAPIIAQAGTPGAVTIATNMAGRGVDIILGGTPFDKDKYDAVVAAGGLHVIGTERHEARRIDNQLRGRAGRQGDPGSSQFYVSMEDDLMRIFGGDRMKNIMKSLKLPEDTPIENKVISKSIESAQRRVEGNNFDIRKHLVEYDDVINHHRKAIYGRRREILLISEGKKQIEKTLRDIILEMVEVEIEQIISFHTAAEMVKDWDLREIKNSVATIFPIEGEISAKLDTIAANVSKLDKIKIRTDIIEYLSSLAGETYDKMLKLANEAGFKWSDVEKAVLLRSIDELWMEHLEIMDYMRRGIGLRGYGQRDPLVEYKKEAFRLFNELTGLIQKQVVYSIYKIGGLQEFAFPTNNLNNITVSAPAKTMGEGTSSTTQIFTENKMKDAEGNKVGRNDLCPCGSGKKYKKCHGN